MRVTGFTADVVELIWERDRGACARCGRGLVRSRRGEDWAVHHREPRGRGGAGRKRWWVNLPCNGVLLCTECHVEVEKKRAEAVEAGFIVSALGIVRPHRVPIIHATHGRVWLDSRGGFSEVEPDPEGVAA